MGGFGIDRYVTGNNNEWCFPPAPTVPHTHSTPFVKQLINATHGLKDTVGSHEVKTLIFLAASKKVAMTPQCRINVKISLLYWSSFIDTSGKIDNENTTDN